MIHLYFPCEQSRLNAILILSISLYLFDTSRHIFQVSFSRTKRPTVKYLQMWNSDKKNQGPQTNGSWTRNGFPMLVDTTLFHVSMRT